MTMGVSLEKCSSPEVSLSIGSVIIWGDIGALDLLSSLLHFRRAPVHCVVVSEACTDELQAIRALKQRSRSYCYLLLAQFPFSACPSAGFPIAMDSSTLFADRQARAGHESKIQSACLSYSKKKSQKMPTSVQL